MGWDFGVLRLRLSLVLVFFSLSAVASWTEILEKGWKAPDSYFIYGYSEAMPPYFAGARAYEKRSAGREALLETEAYREVYDSARPDAFLVSRYDEDRYLRPGLEFLAKHWLRDVARLAAGTPVDQVPGISALALEDNPFWPTGLPAQKSLVALAPLTLSRTQHEMGRIHPWTVFGGAELNWEELFWKRSLTADSAPRWLCGLLKDAFGENASDACDLKALGVRIFTHHRAWVPATLVSLGIVLPEAPTKAAVSDVKYLLTFAPFGFEEGASETRWPETLRKAYRKQAFEAIPHPATLAFSDSPFFNELAKKHGEARQLPLAQELSRYAAGLYRQSFYGLKAFDVSRQRHRFKNKESDAADASIGRDVGSHADDADSPFNRIFNPLPELLGLYGKPIARNIQLWGVKGTLKGEWLLDGPNEDGESITRTRRRIEAAFAEGEKPSLLYRNYYPPMELNGFQVRWYRPLVAWTVAGSGEKPEVKVDSSLVGSFRFQRDDKKVWLSAAVRDRDVEEELATLADDSDGKETTALNVRKLLEFQRLREKPLTRDFATALLNPIPSGTTFAQWKRKLPRAIAEKVAAAVTDEATPSVAPLTFASTVTSAFEHDYWKKVVALSEATFMNGGSTDVPAKNNTDCASTDGRESDPHCRAPGLPDVAKYLRRHYEALGLHVFSQKFRWKTDYAFEWGGLQDEQENLIVVIPGKNRGEAIVMADHYDTAHMVDIYEGETGHVGHRHASRGSDDNYSGTAALMEAAVALKDLSLERDVWLVHITGEEFPADGLGTRALCQALVENKRLTDRANPRIVGVYQLDMVGHDTDKDSDPTRPFPIFQIAPGRGEESAWLAWNAHRVATTWNRLSKSENWDARHGRRKAGERFVIPADKAPEQYRLTSLGKFLQFQAEVRPGWHFRSSLYNTDAQLYQDAGFPVALFMENYDIDRKGYHDSLDNLENIDLDYARGVVSIAIESVAQAAMRK